VVNAALMKLRSHRRKAEESIEELLPQEHLVYFGDTGRFPYGPKPDRKRMQKRFLKIRDLRNRVAHHEPIFFINLETEYVRILTALEWICPVSACWVRATHSIYRLVP